MSITLKGYWIPRLWGPERASAWAGSSYSPIVHISGVYADDVEQESRPHQTIMVSFGKTLDIDDAK